MFVGVVGLAGIAGMLVARSKLDELGAAGVQPQPERSAAGRAAQMFGDRGTHVVERRGIGRQTVPPR